MFVEMGYHSDQSRISLPQVVRTGSSGGEQKNMRAGMSRRKALFIELSPKQTLIFRDHVQPPMTRK
jgi:hypothetical protein